MAEGSSSSSGPSLHAMGLLDVKTDRSKPATDWTEVLTGAVGRFMLGFGRNLGLSFLGTLGEKSAFAPFESSGNILTKMVNESAQNYTGGANSKLGGAFLAWAKENGLDKIVAPLIEAFSQVEDLHRGTNEVQQGQHVSLEALFQITPLDTPGMGRSSGHGMVFG